MIRAKLCFPLFFIMLLLFACKRSEPLPLKQKSAKVEAPKDPDNPLPPGGIRAITYNIRYARGIDGNTDLNRIIEVIRQTGATIVALNEVDRFYSARSNYEDQVEIIAKALGMTYVYQPTTTLLPNSSSGNKPREVGHALLSKYAIIESEKRDFTVSDDYGRGILRAKLNIMGKDVQVYVTHWGLSETVRFNHVKETVFFMNEYPGKSMLLGDLNAFPNENNIIALKSRMTDASSDDSFTFPADNPNRKIDYIFATRDIELSSPKVIDTKASDHRPLIADINLDKVIDNSLLYAKFPESFEVPAPIGIPPGPVSLKTGNWTLVSTSIVAGGRIVYDDRPVSGVDVARMQQNLTTSAYVEMGFDVPDGASKVTIWYGSYFKDPGCRWRLEQSINGGTTWSQVGADVTDTEAVKKQAVFDLNVSGPVRFRIHKIGLGQSNAGAGIYNGRLCIDDFAIYKKSN